MPKLTVWPYDEAPENLQNLSTRGGESYVLLAVADDEDEGLQRVAELLSECGYASFPWESRGQDYVVTITYETLKPMVDPIQRMIERGQAARPFPGSR